jgi:cysteine desulfurase
LKPLFFGGGQERGLRPGTLPTHQIVGLGAACGLATRLLAADQERLTALRERLWDGMASLGGVHLNAAGAPRVPGILSVSVEGVEGESLVTSLTGLALSTGSACNSASEEPSYVLRSLGRDTQLAQSSLRFSLGRFTTPADVDFAIEAVRREVSRLRALSPAAEDPSEDDAEGSDFLLTGEAGGPGQDAWVRFRLSVAGDIVKAARFKAYGCPHTVNVARWLTGQLPGRKCDQGVPGKPSSWADTLGVPVDRLGRLLVVEDALLACFAHRPARH